VESVHAMVRPYGRFRAMDSVPSGLRRAGFTVTEARAEGVSAGRLRGPSFARTFHGARAMEPPVSSLAQAEAYAPLLRPWQALAGVSGLAVLGLPVPWRLARSSTVAIVSAIGRGHPVREGVRTTRIAAGRLETWEVGGTRVLAPAALWAQLAATCTEHELVMVGDAIVTRAEHYPNRRLPGPLATLEELGDVARRWARCAGAGALRAALPRIRLGVESPRETDMRLSIVDAGMPEPEVQARIHDPVTGRFLGRCDLLHRDARVVEEYEGAGHREASQWDRDIEKYRDFARIGLHVVRATHRDFWPSPDRWLADLAAVLRTRTA
jgi:hypothetical protein